jgi:hypothetical protein
MYKLLSLCFLLVISAPGYTKIRLFDTNEVLDAEIQFDLKYFRIHKEDLREKGIPGKFITLERSYDVEILSRGQGSMDNHHSPFKLVFKKSENKGSLFESIKKIKAFVNSEGENYYSNSAILSNYLLYKLVEKVNPYAFKTKMFRLKYTDTSGNISQFENLTFLKEPNKNIAKRFKMTYVPFKFNGPNDPIAMNIKSKVNLSTVELVTAFEFIAGNFDNAIPGIYSDMFKGPAKSEKNMKMLKDANDKYYPVMYDFDFSGLLYKGVCWWEVGYGVMDPSRQSHYPNLKEDCDKTFIKLHFTADLNNYHYKANVIKHYHKIKKDILEWVSENSNDLKRLPPSYLTNLYDYLEVVDEVIADQIIFGSQQTLE